jgi:RHS repeat-associated protein
MITHKRRVPSDKHSVIDTRIKIIPSAMEQFKSAGRSKNTVFRTKSPKTVGFCSFWSLSLVWLILSVFVLTASIHAQASQVINTVAGIGTSGYSGDGGPATSAGITYPFGVAYDAAGNIYIADGYNGRVRMVTHSTGIISTLAGGGSTYNLGTGVAATTAALGTPSGVALDVAGNIYICDMGTQLIYKVTASTGIITIVAGNGSYGYAGDGGPATSASLGNPTAIALDAVGNLYFSETSNNVVRKVNVSTGIISTVVGTGTAGYSGNGGPATSATIHGPWGVAVDSTGNIYVSDTGNSSVRKVDASTGLISTVAGVGTHECCVSGEGGPATSAGLWYQTGIAVDGTGNLYIAGGDSEVVQKVSASTGIITTVAGTFEIAGFSGDAGPATSAMLYSPQAVAISPTDNIAIADWANLRIRQITPGAPPNLAGAYKRAITIDHTKVHNTNQTDFPILVSGTYPFLAATTNGGRVLNANGYDIVFTSDAAGQNLLDYEIDTYNPANGTASFWVRIPALSHTTDTTIYMFYGIPNLTASLGNTTGAWRNNYLSVYHLGNGTSVGVTDSGSARYTLAGSAMAGTGIIGGGVAFNGDPGTYLYHDSVPAYPSGQSPVTLEAWVRWAPGANGVADMLGYGGNTAYGSRVAIGSDGTTLWQEFEGYGIASSWSPDGNWHHIVGVYGGGALSATSQLYVDGIPLSVNVNSGTPAITTTEFKIGGIPTVTFADAFNGSLDEVRISSEVRSADWIATEYFNQLSPSTFYSMGSEVGGGQGGGSGNLTCSPSILYTRSNTTCSIGLPSSATAQVTFSLDGQSSAIASPNSLGLFDALIDLSSASVGSHTVAFSYPGDGINPAQSGNTTVMVEAAGTTLPNESMVYQFSITKPDGSSGFAPNGNVLGYFDSVNGMWSQIQYDGLNRLTSARVTPPIMGMQASYFCWSFDSFGNRTGQTLSNQALSSNGTQPCQPASGATSSSSQMQYGSTNQIASGTWQSQQGAYVTGTPSYDANGSMTADLQNQYLYDAEGRVCAVQIPSAPSLPSQMVQYLYDAEGNRIAKGNITQWSCDGDTFSLTNEYVLDQGGEQVTEFDGSPNGGKWIHTNAYAGGRLIATYDNLGVHYQLADWLGTRRAQVSPAGAIEETCQSLPFGDQLNCVQTSLATANDATEHHFTGKERDAESGLDYFGARYYGSNMGRWMSPDWSAKEDPVPYAKLDNPQSLNLYGYVLNNPLSQKDDDGHEIIYADGLKNSQLVRDSVTAILANPNTSSYLSGYVGPNAPNLIIQSGDLGPPTVTTLPNGQTLTTTVQGNTAPDIQTTQMNNDPPQTTLTGATITIDNNTSKGDTPGVMIHESVHAGEAQKNPAQFNKDAKAERGQSHDSRLQEQRANGVRAANEKQIKQQIKQIEKDRKKDQQ